MVAAIQSRVRAAQTPVFSIEDVRALSERNQEPAWLRESRLAAWELYEGLPMPGRDDEAWRRTDYRGIRWAEAGRTINAPGGLQLVPAESLEPLIGDEQGGMIVFVDGKLVQFDLHPSLAAQGVVVADLLSAAEKYEELVRPRLMTQAVVPHESKFAALHAALWTHGVFIYVPRNVDVSRPIHVVMYNSQPGQTMGHVLVALDENSQATVLVDYGSVVAEEQSLFVGATELLVGDHANLKFVCLQDWNRATYEFSTLRGRVGRDAHLDWVIGNMGGEFVKQFIEMELDGQGATGRVSGMFFADGVQMFDQDTQQVHNAPLTSSDLLFKGAAKDEARTVWQGMIKSLPKMQKIDGFQACRNLVLSDDARMDAIPGLEIEADDVRCTHAATFGTLEEQPVFYLMSRGVPREEAELAVSEGFFEELLERIPFPRVQDLLRVALETKILGRRRT